MIHIPRLAAAALALCLGACALAPESQPIPDMGRVPAAFEMSGRIAVRQGERSEIARLRWTHRPSGDLWVFASPLGNEVARIESGEAGATLRQAGGPTATAPSFAVLAERFIGLALEPATLAAWLHGGAARSEHGGWQVALEETQGAGAVQVARRLSATRGDVVVRVVVDEYRPLPE
ncbi:MAG TPA: outer membrane lipoprotein LolB [Usitatibacter sp.]|nr:outer membrane lipoprotein LolB [Usitatibacter sp.]